MKINEEDAAVFAASWVHLREGLERKISRTSPGELDSLRYSKSILHLMSETEDVVRKAHQAFGVAPGR